MSSSHEIATCFKLSFLREIILQMDIVHIHFFDIGT